MRPDVIGQVGVVLGSVGFALQWLRAQKGFPEWLYYVFVGLATVGGMALATDTVVDWKAYILTNWPLMVTLYGVTMGGTQGASSAAKGIAAAKPGSETSQLVPLTNSKG